mgnify:CR=1 FL=1
MRESTIQAASVREARKLGWRGFKFVSPGYRGVPDYIFIKGPPLQIVFVEFKAPGKLPTLIQLVVHRMLRKMGARVEVIDSVEQARLVFAAS